MKAASICPKCRRAIPLDDINVATDIALCRRCDERWSYAELVGEQEAGPLNLMQPPAGTWLVSSSPQEFEVGASTRSPAAFFLVPFMCVWSGGSLGGIYGTQISKHHFDPVLSLFGLPFFIGTLVLGWVAVMAICGRVVVKVAGDAGTVWTGFGPIGWKRRFDWSKVTSIQSTENRSSRGVGVGVGSQQITIVAEKSLAFASGIRAERLSYLLAVLRQKWRENRH